MAEKEPNLSRLSANLPHADHQEMRDYAEAAGMSVTGLLLQHKRAHDLLMGEIERGTKIFFQRPEDSEPKEVIILDFKRPRKTNDVTPPNS